MVVMLNLISVVLCNYKFCLTTPCSQVLTEVKFARTFKAEDPFKLLHSRRKSRERYLTEIKQKGAPCCRDQINKPTIQ